MQHNPLRELLEDAELRCIISVQQHQIMIIIFIANRTNLGENVHVIELDGYIVGSKGVALGCFCDILPARVFVKQLKTSSTVLAIAIWNR